MRPLTDTRPKVMLPLANKPMLEHLLVEIKKAGIQEFIIVIGYQGETIRDYFKDGRKWDIHISYVTQEKCAGTADALRLAQGLVNEEFLAVNGDVLLREADVRQLISKGSTAISLVELKKVQHLGVAEVDGARVMRLHEKVAQPPSNLANAGAYLFTLKIFEAISRITLSPRGEYEITDALQWLLDRGEHVTYHMLTHWLDLTHPWDLLSANESLIAAIEPDNQAEAEANIVLKGPISVGPGTIIRANSYIIGPVIIGRDCQIGPNSYIRPHTSIGDSCHIGSAVEIKNSIIMKGSRIPHHNYIGDSVIGEDCNFGAGTKIANLRLDKKEIAIQGIKTGRTKLGAIIGDGVQTGINASINTGSLVGSYSYIGPGAIAGGVIAPHSRIH